MGGNRLAACVALALERELRRSPLSCRSISRRLYPVDAFSFLFVNREGREPPKEM